MSEIRYEVTDGVAVITLDAPHRRNALTPQMAADLVAALDEVDADESIGATIIGGGASFCAGADLGVLDEAGADPADDHSFRVVEGIYNAFVRVGTVKTPTVAAVRGAAVGAGMNLVLAPDLRIVAHDARLLSGFARIGVHPGGGHFPLLHRAVGREGAAAMGLFSGEISGSRAAEIGMAWEAVDDAEVDAVAFDFARKAAADPALSRRMVASFRRETVQGGIPWEVGVDVERSAQMWSFRRKQAGRSDAPGHGDGSR